MPLVKVGPKHQVVIPKAVREKLGIDPGDYVEVAFEHNQAVIKRKKVIDDFPVTDEPIGPETREGIRQGMEEAAAGNVVGRFGSAKELIHYLHQTVPSPPRKP